MTKGLLFLLAFAMAGCASPGPARVSDDPKQAAQSFYETLLSYQVRGLPQGKAWKALEPFFTEERVADFQAVSRDQAFFIENNPGEKPPWTDGDVFSSLFEGPERFTIGEPSLHGDRAVIPVYLTSTKDAAVVSWTDTLVLHRTPRGWLVHNIRYGGDWPFASKGSLMMAIQPLG